MKLNFNDTSCDVGLIIDIRVRLRQTDRQTDREWSNGRV